jgi:HEPN domain-containing protein
MVESSDKYNSYFLMSIAYLEIGEAASTHGNLSGEFQNAIAYQMFHAIELFLKYAILKKTNETIIKCHNLESLFEQYATHYPDDLFHIENYFDFSNYQASECNNKENELYEAHVTKYTPEYMGQHLRYPPDCRTGGYSFKLDTDIFIQMKNKFSEINDKL